LEENEDILTIGSEVNG